jgi:hypothetical protein
VWKGAEGGIQRLPAKIIFLKTARTSGYPAAWQDYFEFNPFAGNASQC